MFCPECGKEIAEAEVICTACGASVLPAEQTQEAEPVQENLEDIQISFDEMEVEAETPAAEQTQEEPAEEEAETAEEAEEEEVEEEDEDEDEIEIDMDADAIVAEFLSETAAAEEAKEQEQEEAAAQEPAPKKEKKPRKKLWAILIPVIILALLAAAAGAVYFLATQTYEKANTCVEAKEYDQALALYEKFFFYADSQEKIDELNRLQKAYNDAAALATANDYVSAIAVLSQLGDYRDSLQLMQVELPYARAAYLMASAETGDVVALSQHPAYANAVSTPADPAITLYEGAAEVYLSLGDHADSALLASQCWSRIAFIYMEQEMFEQALTCLEHLNEADHEIVMAQYMTFCADTDALASLADSIRIRASMEEEMAQQLKEAEEAAKAEAEATEEGTEETTEETDDTTEEIVVVEKITYLDLVDAELALLESFTSDLLYYDIQLKDAVAMYKKGLETELSALDSNGNCTDLATWYAGSAMRALAVEILVESVNFLSDNPQLQASFAGKADLYNAYSVLENVLPLYLSQENQKTSGEDGTYYAFENTTGITFTLKVTHEFLTEEGETVLFHEADPVEIAADASVKLTFLAPADDVAWAKHNVTWSYEVVQKA